MYGLPVFSVVVSTVKCGCESLLGYGLVALGWRGSVCCSSFSSGVVVSVPVAFFFV